MKQKCLTIFFILSLLCSCDVNNNNASLQYDWEQVSFTEARIDESIVNEAFVKASALNFLYSILIIRDGKIVSEEYFNGHEKEIFCSIKSVSKSFLSAALGIASEKSILSLDDKLTELVSDYNPLINDSRFHDITLGNLIKMKSGLDSDRNIYSMVVDSENWLSTIFQMSLKNNPGSKFVYSTPGTHLLSAVLTNATSSSSSEFVNQYLLKEMGIVLGDWEKDPQGIYFGGNNMYFTTRNMAVLGLLYLQKGFLNGKQIVQERWIDESLVDHTGRIGDWGPLKNVGYGYLWWLGEMQNYKVFTAIGHGGQFVFCVPDLNLIIATNAHSNIWWEEANEQELAILNIISNHIIPAIKK